MGRSREWELLPNEFKGEAYKSPRIRKVRVQSKLKDGTINCCMLTLPSWMNNMEFDVLLIPKKNEKTNESTTEVTTQ